MLESNDILHEETLIKETLSTWSFDWTGQCKKGPGDY